MSYGASVLLMAPPIDSARPSLAAALDRDAVLGEQCGIVAMSARRGTLVSTSRSSVSRPAAISGSAGVLGAADDDFAGERPAAADANLVHVRPIRGSAEPGRATPRWRMYFPALSA